MTDDFLRKTGEASGAADVTASLREALARMDPTTAQANAPYAFWRRAHDVLEATAEIERVRPRIGRQIAARAGATIAGGQAAGVKGAFAGFVFGPLFDSLLSSGATTKLQTAHLMTQLAAAIRSGNVSRVTSLSARLKAMSRRTAPSVGVGTAQAVDRQPQE